MHSQDDLLIVEALIKCARECDLHDPDRSGRALTLAESVAGEHGPGLEDALFQIE
ncbi:hypothetical protein [Natronosalvus rutilus]|uniref:Uncharacterized protein n=1 Tax=Natronosalvus rutilus TaxID=2953753 RepID=A0A9E7SZF9_9EURY|nr:hypothetical protein [Natronosalvus rutilus]UTF55888.1 hypothetical protein NGM29_20005 [Natronosalvus rutilus]